MRYLIFLILTLQIFSARSAHIVGGDIYYDYLGNNQYRIHVLLYRDCLSTGAQFDDPLYVGIYNQNNALVQQVEIPFPGSTQLPVVFNNPCVTPPTNICTEVAHYQQVVNLPPIVGGYTVTYQRCCRGPNITNLIAPDDTGLTLTAHVPGLDTGMWENSSPRFLDYPPLLLCNNAELVFDHSAVDPDGDQLVYSLTTPFAGGTSFNPQPIPPPPPVYPPVNWGGGFTAANPLGPGASITINPTTGLLEAAPNLTGLFVVGIKVEEYRNGVLINETIRDFIFRVFNCQLQLDAILPVQEDLPGFVSYCQGLDVDFVNNSYGGTNYAWDFGVPGTNTDVSTAFQPSFTYPSPGSYTATLVVNPGWPCTDTAYIDIVVNNELEISYTSQDSLCLINNSFDFVANSTSTGLDYTWDFGPTATPSTATGQTVNGVSFSNSGVITVSLHGEVGLCEADYVNTIFITPEPTAEMVLPANIECEGLTISFGNNSQFANEYFWDFGVAGIASDTSNVESPTYQFPGPGTYTVTLSAQNSPSCVHTIDETITLNDPIVVAFTSEDEMCFTNNSFNFDGTVSGPPGTVYTWNFGPDASVQTSNDIDVSNVSFNTTGVVPITLTGVHQNCSESVTNTIYLFSPPTIDFALEPGLQCAPFNAQFIDKSWAETPITYFWDFGDNSTSNEQNPSHIYTEVGNYPVTLTIMTDEGCVDTLTLLQADIINVRPNPEAGFDVTPDFTDICNSEVQFIDQSQGGVEFFYWYDDSTIFYNGAEGSPIHQYLNAGTHYPYQIVTNEWGCKDTATNQLYIEPWALFIPNTFTPDGDQHNHVFKAEHYFDVYEWEMRIYNRFGQILFESYDSEDYWDGTYNGTMVQDGVYAYTIRYRTCEPLKPDHFITGHINVLR